MVKHKRNRRKALPQERPAAGNLQSHSINETYRWAAACALIPIVAGAMYASTLSGEFVWDDQMLILEDYSIKSFHYLKDVFLNDFFFRHENDQAYGYYRPIVAVSYMLDYALWGPRPLGFHLTNAALHALSSLLALFVLLELGLGRGASWVGAALFAVHPMHTESVAWIAGRTDLVAFVFSAGAMLVHLRAARSASLSSSRRALLFAAAALLFSLGLLSKEVAIVVPLWLLAIHIASCRRSAGAIAGLLAPFAMAIAAYAIWRFAFIHIPVPESPPGHGTIRALLSAAPTIVRYLAWLAFPVAQSAYVQNPYVTHILDWRLLASLAFLAAATAAALRLRRTSPLGFLCVSMLALSFAPVLNLVRVAAPWDMGAVMAERFLYFPSLPFAALAGLAFSWAARACAPRGRIACAAVRTAALVLLAVLAAATLVRNRVWLKNEQFFEATLRSVPTAPLLWANLAQARIGRRDWAGADRALREAERLEPENPRALAARALWDVGQGRLKDAVAAQRKLATRSSHASSVSRNNLAYLYRITGLTEEAARILKGIVAAGRDYADVHFNLAEIARERGDLDGARREYGRALGMKPDDLKLGSAFASMEMKSGRFVEALAIFEALLEFHPGNAGLLNNIGLVREAMGDPRAALESYSLAIEADPGYEKARRSYDRLRAAAAGSKAP